MMRHHRVNTVFSFVRFFASVACFFGATSFANAQITISGIVVDSVTLDPLPNTAIMLKNSKQGVYTNDKGFFQISSETYDTLLFSRVGYQTYEYPLLTSEKDVLIMIREQVKKLREVVVDVYDDEKPVHSAPRVVKPLSLADGISSPFTYFSKEEKEKRILARFQKEQLRVQTYVDLITREAFRREIMDAFDITEDLYYEMLARFNSQSQDVHYLHDGILIRKRIMEYFNEALKTETQK